jgi:hypothetical protein
VAGSHAVKPAGQPDICAPKTSSTSRTAGVWLNVERTLWIDDEKF